MPSSFPCAPQKQPEAEAFRVRSPNPTDCNSLYQRLRKKNRILGFGLGAFLSHFVTAFRGISVSPKQETYPRNQAGKENSHQSEDKRAVAVPGVIRVDSCVRNGHNISWLGSTISKQTEHYFMFSGNICVHIAASV